MLGAEITIKIAQWRESASNVQSPDPCVTYMCVLCELMWNHILACTVLHICYPSAEKRQHPYTLSPFPQALHSLSCVGVGSRGCDSPWSWCWWNQLLRASWDFAHHYKSKGTIVAQALVCLMRIHTEKIHEDLLLFRGVKALRTKWFDFCTKEKEKKKNGFSCLIHSRSEHPIVNIQIAAALRASPEDDFPGQCWVMCY